jgi:hypothetical protein
MADSYTFIPSFDEFSVMYRGITAVEIREGFLWTEYADGWRQIGPCSSYAEAVATGKAGPDTPYDTEEKWIQHIVDSSQNASDAEAYAAGERGGTPVASDDPAYNNNAKYYSNQTNAYKTQAETAKTAAEIAQTAAETARTAAETAQAVAEEFKKDAEAWAVGQIDSVDVQSSDPRYQNNAKYYSEQSSSFASDAGSYSEDARAHADNAQTSENDAAASALTASTKADEAAASASSANESKETAAQWATGDTIGTPSEYNNALYYAGQAKLWANNGTDEGEPNATNNAKAYAESAATEALAAATSELNATEKAYQAESWAVGTRDGNPDMERDEASTNNSRYWASLSASSASAASSSAADAAASETNAAASATNVLQYVNDAKGYSESASASATNANTSKNSAATSATNAATSEANAHTSELAAAESATQAAQSESDAAQHATDAQTAKTAAETAQTLAELAITRNIRINSDSNWEVWNVTQEEWEDTGHKSIAYAEFEVSYQNSNQGTAVPTGTWTNNPEPESGKFLWIRMKYIWTNGRVDYFYNVSYIGANGQGSVDSVNGMGGDVVLDGTDIFMDSTVEDKETIYQAITRIGSAITDAEIDNLF